MKKKLLSFSVLLVVDAAVIIASYVAAYLIRLHILTALSERYQELRLYPLSYFLSHYYLVLLWLAVFASNRLYTKRFPLWEEVKQVTKSCTLSSFLVIIIMFLSQTERQFSRTVVVLAWLISLFLAPLARYYTKLGLTKLNIWKKKIIVIGVHQTSLKAIRNLRKNKSMGYEVVSIVDDDPQKIGKKYLGIQVIGPVAQLEELIRSLNSKDIMLATPHLPREELKKLLVKCETMCESMWLIPRTGDFITEGVEIEKLGDVLSLYIKRNLSKPWNILLKNVFERLLTALILLALSPLFLVIAVAIKLDSKGPVLFVQTRLGKGRRLFPLYKFRSMHVNHEQKFSDFLEKNAPAREEWTTFKKLRNHDPRVTRVGRIIRRYSLDELPQLINVLLGYMSLVGPRPYIEEELKGNHGFIGIIAQVKPGITGLWQVSGRSELPFEERLNLDEYYVRNWSLWLDIVILFRTFRAFFSSRGAY